MSHGPVSRPARVFSIGCQHSTVRFGEPARPRSRDRLQAEVRHRRKNPHGLGPCSQALPRRKARISIQASRAARHRPAASRFQGPTPRGSPRSTARGCASRRNSCGHRSPPGGSPSHLPGAAGQSPPRKRPPECPAPSPAVRCALCPPFPEPSPPARKRARRRQTPKL